MIQFLLSTQTNPYWNVAVENYLLSLEEREAVTLYLWKNRRTVVIGQHQNPFAECNVRQLESDGGFVMRRSTGGGAVYHDDGNINFSFVVPKALYNQQRQFEVIRRAIGCFGLETELSGRNDILCQGRKFSGNAFAKGRWQDLHHGTLLIKGNMDDLQRYLKVRPSKLQKHGVASVSSRVVNLSELVAPSERFPEGITSNSIVRPLLDAFEAVYGEPALQLDFEQIRQSSDVQVLYNKYASDEWRFGRWRTFVAQRSGQFDWGAVDLAVEVDQEHNLIRDLQMACDGLDLTLVDRARMLLVGASTLCPPKVPDDAPELGDIVRLLFGEQCADRGSLL